MFSYDFCDISNNTFLKEYLRTTASNIVKAAETVLRLILQNIE